MAGYASKFLSLLAGIPELVSGAATSVTAAAGYIPALNSSSVIDASIGGTGLATVAAHNVVVGEGTSPVGVVAPSATSGVPLVSQGSSSDPHFGTAVVAGGGTGLATLTAHAVLLGEGTSNVAFAAPSTAGYVLTDNGATSDPTFQALPSSGNPTATILAAGNIAAGSLVNVYNNAGTANVVQADNTSSATSANGVALSAITSGVSGVITFGAIGVSGLSGLTPGQLFLGTAGAPTSTAPSSTGDVIQPIGLAITATTAVFNPGQNYNVA
jgi:hypothetical protein